jgi:hypothetical protein
MTPRWLTIEKLVSELGSVCRSQHDLHNSAVSEHIPEEAVDRAVTDATRVVSMVIAQPEVGDDEVVRTAWQAIAVAQDAIAALRQTVEHSRRLRERARQLQHDSVRRRDLRGSPPGPRPARRGTPSS